MKYFFLSLSGLLALVACHKSPPEPDPQLALKPGFEQPLYAQYGNELIFKSTAANAIAYLWSFGDNSTSREVNPTHVYAKSGTYQVMQRIYNAQHDSAQITQELLVAKPLALPAGLAGNYRGRLVSFVRIFGNGNGGGDGPKTVRDTTFTISEVNTETIASRGYQLSLLANPPSYQKDWLGHAPNRAHYLYSYASPNPHIAALIQKETAGDSLYFYDTNGGLGAAEIRQFYGKKR